MVSFTDEFQAVGPRWQQRQKRWDPDVLGKVPVVVVYRPLVNPRCTIGPPFPQQHLFIHVRPAELALRSKLSRAAEAMMSLELGVGQRAFPMI